MDPVEVLPPWIPEDDLLLKNAIETGASLESLAKGAVRFSRRYSLTELRDRWRALLYDADVSAAAAAAMANLELARAGGTAGVGSGEGAGKKRRVQSIRRHYYAMQKRLRRQRHGVAGSDVKDAVAGCEGKEKLVIGDNLGLNRDVVNNLVGCGDCSGLEGVGVGVGQLSNSVSDVPLWKTIEDVSVPDIPANVSVEGQSCGSEGRVDLKGDCGNGGLKLNDDAKNGSECILNLANEDELLFMDVDGKEVMAADKDKPCYDNVDLLLLSSPCDVQGDGDGHKPQKLETERKVAGPSGRALDGLVVVANPLGGNCADHPFVSDSGNDAGPSAAVQSPRHEYSEGLMICLLNTEDPDIPCNDGTYISAVVPALEAPISQPIVQELGYLESVINQSRNEADRSLKKEAVLCQSFTASQTVQQVLVPNVNSSHRPVVLGLKSEIPGRNSFSAVSRQNNNVNVNVNPSHSRLVHATVMPASDGHLKLEETIAPASAHAKAEEHKALSKSEAKSLSLDQEGGDIEDNDDDDNDNDDNDDELPNFSDAEEMILEMDLSPMDQDTNASREVYQQEQSKRTIMRLEQGAQSSMGRAISSHGAFAVLYGKFLKKFIRKSKVILGRATNDVHVDIDLGKEGQAANKISRRQALIKMEDDGSFIIKNLGKRSIFLNGKEILTGQARSLGASSLIEITGISLIFEVNNRCVRKFLENMNEKR